MAVDVTYTVLNSAARRHAVAPLMVAIAAEIAASAQALTPVDQGVMAGSYSLKPGRDPGTALAVAGPVPHAKYVEYGTRRQPARAPMGRALAAARAKYGG